MGASSTPSNLLISWSAPVTRFKHADLVLFNNRRNWVAAGALERSTWIANGVDLDVFQVRRPQVHCPGDEATDVTAVDHVKLFRNRPDLRFEFRIHEQIIPAIRRAGGEVGWTDAFVVHSGSDRTPQGRQRKVERDLQILKLDLEEHPDHPFVLFNLGMTHADTKQHWQAIIYLKRCLEVSDPGESHVRKAYALLSGAYSHAGQHESALTTCRQGLELYPEDAELQFRLGVLYHQLGRHQESIAAYQRLLSGNEQRHFASIDQGITSFKARQNLAVVHVELGQWERAEQQWRAVVEEVPDYRTGWRGLGEALLRQNQTDAALAVARQLQQQLDGVACEGLLLEANILKQAGQIDEALLRIERAVEAHPGDLPTLE